LISDYVTPRQLEFLALKANGLSSDEIAEKFKLQPRAIWRSTQRARARAGLKSTEQLIARLVLEGSIVINDDGDFITKAS
jgi:DNA-binding CsgD family transcriptional regulator